HLEAILFGVLVVLNRPDFRVTVLPYQVLQTGLKAWITIPPYPKMSRTQSSMLLILLPGLACAAMVRSYPRLSTHQSSDSQHNDMGLLGYAFAVRTSQIPGPWSWALDWALCALRQLTGPLQRPTPERRGATTAPRETHVVSGWDGPAAGTGAGAGAGPEMLARGGDVRGGDGSGSTASFG
ncbi:hypothetical protein Vretimale_2706, partial [Volvox reticuliferus]